MFVAKEWRIKIQTELKKPHRKQTSIAKEFTISFTIIKFGVTIVYIGKEFEFHLYLLADSSNNVYIKWMENEDTN